KPQAAKKSKSGNPAKRAAENKALASGAKPTNAPAGSGFGLGANAGAGAGGADEPADVDMQTLQRFLGRGR
ncbi:MAG: signal recognition particle protein, partial [Microbacterium sp.]|nr:signal recognition particle protein [Microbacterium sp.]